ncbi:MAG: phosphotransferase [Pseudomonadota bacterium]
MLLDWPTDAETVPPHPFGQESVALDELIRKQVLPLFVLDRNATVSPLGAGLINLTFLVTSGDQRFVLQRVNPLFSPAIHENIRAVTTALTAAGMVTPALVPARDGALYARLPAAGDAPGAAPTVWRLMTHIAGVSFDIVAGAAQAREAGALVARFHAALAGLPHAFVGLRAGVHDTPRHLTSLRRAAAEHPTHRLFSRAAPLAERILEAAAALPVLPALPALIGHGDLKFNNFLFAGSSVPDRDHATCLIDLDTVGPLALAFELGDAWRSWCNKAGEDCEEAALDIDVLAASLDGYQGGLGRGLHADERRALLLGPEWISLELAARFAADALVESYFGWDPARFAGRGEHNLVRALGQFSLYGELARSRARRARLLAITA